MKISMITINLDAKHWKMYSKHILILIKKSDMFKDSIISLHRSLSIQENLKKLKKFWMILMKLNSKNNKIDWYMMKFNLFIC